MTPHERVDRYFLKAQQAFKMGRHDRAQRCYFRAASAAAEISAESETTVLTWAFHLFDHETVESWRRRARPERTE